RLLDHDPAAGFQRHQQTSYCALSPRRMRQEKSYVHEVKFTRRWWLLGTTLAAHVQVRKGQRLKKTRFDIHRDHAPRGPHPRAEPGSDRSAAADLQARPPFIDAPLV